MTPRLGTDGNRIVYPVRGIVQGVREVGRHPQRRTLAYVATLILAALVTAGALLAAGYGLESPVTVAALALAAAIGAVLLLLATRNRARDSGPGR